MIEVPNYQLKEKIYQSERSLVYRAIRISDNKAVVLKFLNLPYPTPEDIARFKREYEITHSLNPASKAAAPIQGVIRVYALENHQQQPIMVLEDIGGQSLRELTQTNPLPIAHFLPLAIEISSILAEIHQQRIIHKDINPSNIIAVPPSTFDFKPQNPKSDSKWQVKFIDFGIAIRLSKEKPSFHNANVLAGTLAYISPEQTGRMNCNLDYRTDFYSLGATFYHVLTGHLPFNIQDTVELVHAHIAKTPLPPQQHQKNIPPILSDIILKLMAKNVEDRYQSAYGLKADLENCWQQWQKNKSINAFSLGNHDVSNVLHIPQKLYGREEQLEILLNAFRQTLATNKQQQKKPQAKTQFILVAGQPGIGKSALINELHKPLTEQRGYFISGKFEQLQRHIPYQAIIQAFTELTHHLLTGGNAEVTRWRDKLITALSPNEQIIIDIIPELELIIGPQPSIAELDPTESQNRFNLTFQNFINVFARPEHPLVMFIDDLQWADAASLNLLQVLLTDVDNQALFIIGAYRDNEVKPEHPLSLSLDHLAKAGVLVKTLTLPPLTATHINHLLAQTFHCNLLYSQPLSQLIFRKTGGNPFFVHQFLQTVYQEELIVFKPHKNKQQKDSAWAWDLKGIEALKITANVATLMVNKLQQLPPATQTLLQYSACIGNRFNLKILALISQQSQNTVLNNLWPALQADFIYPLDNQYQLFNALENPVSARFKFLHDRIQQAAYSLISPTEKPSLHSKIGHLLLTTTDLELTLFDVVNHLNKGQSLVTTKAEKYQLAELNLQAGERAKQAAAYKTALSYLQTGVDNLPTHSWKQNYTLTYNLYKALAEINYLVGNFTESKNLIEVALNHAKNNFEKATLYKLLIIQHTLTSNYQLAMDFGKKALQLLGVTFPEDNFEAVLKEETDKIDYFLSTKNTEDLLDNPKTMPPEQALAVDLLLRMGSTSYYVAPQLHPIFAAKSAALSLKYGYTTRSSTAYIVYAFHIAHAQKAYQKAYQLAKIGLKLCKKANNLGLKCRDFYAATTFIICWIKPIAHVQAVYTTAYQAGLASGELQFVGYTLMHKIFGRFYEGETLQTVLTDTTKFLAFAKKTKNTVATEALIGCELILQNLSGHTSNQHLFETPFTTEITFLDTCYTNKSYSSICRYQILKAQTLYLYQQYKAALECIESIAQYLPFIHGIYQTAEYNFYYSLILLALYPTASPKTQAIYWQQIENNQTEMKLWADSCEANFEHKYLLVAAEMARINNQNWTAVDLYDQAIESAQNHKFNQNTALACELAARFYLLNNKPKLAHPYLVDAHYYYQLWGANHKVTALQAEYPHLVSSKTPLSQAQTNISPTHLTYVDTTHTVHNAANILDLEAIIKASQTISGQIVLKELLEQLIKIVIKNAGAQKGFLILPKENNWFIEAQAEINAETDNEQIALETIPLKNNQQLSTAIVNYVSRTKQSVVLDNATQQGRFTQAPYVLKNQPKSILCTPLVNQGQLTGILYLENNLTTNTFTASRLEILKLLSTQMAISIKNALLYNTLEQNEKKYRTIFEDSKDGIFITRPNGEILDINPAGLKLFGYTKAEMKNINIISIYANPDDRYRLQEILEPNGMIKDFEVKLRKKDGQQLDCLITGVTQKDANGNILTYQGIIRDITKQKHLEQERLQFIAIQQELNIAKDIQKSLLPPPKPKWKIPDVICYSTPASKVGGDFYAYHAFRSSLSRHLAYAVAVGDISGKGVSAALFMTTSLLQLNSTFTLNFSPAARLMYLDKLISAYTKAQNQNCALCYAEINIPRNITQTQQATLKVVNAGGIPPYIKRANGKVEHLMASGIPLGVGLTPPYEYQEVSAFLLPGDLVIMVSDGVIEAHNKNNQILGFDYFEKIISNSPPNLKAEQMLDYLKQTVLGFIGNAEQHDDLTIIVAKI